MVFTKEQARKVQLVIDSIPTQVNKIIQDNMNLQEITKEYLGESMSDEILKKIIKEQIEKEVFEKVVGVMFGE